MNILIRTEANATTAMGHMMRCLSIADAARLLGHRVIFVVAEAQSAVYPSGRGYDTEVLDKKWDDFDNEISLISNVITKHKADLMLIDSYWVSEEYVKAAGEAVTVAYIDDLHERIWPCDIVINYSLYASDYDYINEYKYAILGPSYMPIRQEYQSVSARHIREKADKVLVLTGGSDNLHFMLSFVKAVIARGDNSVHYTLITGQFNKDIDELDKLAADMDAITIIRSLPCLKEAMEEHDILVTAGGTTLYEMAATGLPGICFSMADNQLPNVNSFDKGGYAIYAGDIRNDFSYEKLAEDIERLLADYNQRRDMSRRLSKLVDGKGAERIVEALEKCKEDGNE